MTDTNDAPAVLILDDDRFLLDMYSAKFLQSGFRVESCSRTDDALALLRGGYDPVAILFDLVMPDKDGFDFLTAIGAEKLARRATLIALTNQSNDADRAQAEKLGANKYVIKATMIPSEVVNMTKDELAKKA